MPFVMLEVCQDLYQELRLCPSMKLVRSDSDEGFIQFVPLSNKSFWGDYKSPLLTSPMFGNRVKESGNSNSPLSTSPMFGIRVKESGNSNSPILPSPMFGNRVKESGNSNSPVLTSPMFGNSVTKESENSNSPELIIQVSDNDMRSPSDDDASHNSPSQGGNASENIGFVVPVTEGNGSSDGSIDQGNTSVQKGKSSFRQDSHFERFTSASKLSSSALNIDSVCRYIELDSRDHNWSSAPSPELSNSSSTQQYSSCLAIPSSYALSSDIQLKCEGNSKKYSSKKYPRQLKNRGETIKYPRECDNCFTIYEYASSFLRHKENCEEIRQRIMALQSACKIENHQSEQNP